MAESGRFSDRWRWPDPGSVHKRWALLAWRQSRPSRRSARNPEPSAVTREPKMSLSVVVTATALPRHRLPNSASCAPAPAQPRAAVNRGIVVLDLRKIAGRLQFLTTLACRDQLKSRHAAHTSCRSVARRESWKIWIAHEFRAVKKGPPKSFRREVHRLRPNGSQLLQDRILQECSGSRSEPLLLRTAEES